VAEHRFGNYTFASARGSCRLTSGPSRPFGCAVHTETLYRRAEESNAILGARARARVIGAGSLKRRKTYCALSADLAFEDSRSRLIPADARKRDIDRLETCEALLPIFSLCRPNRSPPPSLPRRYKQSYLFVEVTARISADIYAAFSRRVPSSRSAPSEDEERKRVIYPPQIYINASDISAGPARDKTLNIG